MGSPKPLLPWPSGRGDDTTLVEYQVSQLRCAGIDEIIVVLGHRAEEVEPIVGGAGVQSVLNPDYAMGKTTSIRAGLAKIDAGAETVMLLAVDQPRPASINPPGTPGPHPERCRGHVASAPWQGRPSDRVRLAPAARAGRDNGGGPGHQGGHRPPSLTRAPGRDRRSGGTPGPEYARGLPARLRWRRRAHRGDMSTPARRPPIRAAPRPAYPFR